MSASLINKRISRRVALGGGVGLLGVGGTTAWAANRFLIPHVEATVEQTPVAAATGTASANTYGSDTTAITIEKVVSGSGNDTVTAFVADITVTGAQVIRSAFANGQFGTNIIANPSAIAASQNAVLAINGDYYGFRDTGIVVRNGKAYRDLGARQGLALGGDGSAVLYDETTTSADALIADGVWQTLSFGPGLVEAGRVIEGIDAIEIDTNVGNHSIQGSHPRTAVGLVAPNHWLWVVVDGRSAGYSRGMTLPELAKFFVDRGASVAYNLDGGGSSAMYFNGALVNNPLGRNRERGTSDILYVAG
ncbi:MAG: phosphodiester glycosidase family protein [Micropruina sp.]|nr:phosphodiester glycosidase family protein [Micropruina sp.]